MYKLLIVDDEAIERKAIKHIISQEDLKISVTEEASNGRQAIAKANVFFPDIIIMDIKMPGISGLEAVSEIKKFHPGCKIIFLTAFNYFEYAQQAIQVGVEDFLIKPANKTKVTELMKKIIEDLDRQREALIRQKEMEHKLMQFTKYFESELLSLLMMGEIEEEEAMTYLNELSMDFSMGLCAVVSPDYSTYVPKVTSKLHQCIINKRCVDHIKKEFDKEDVNYLINLQGDCINILIIFEQLVDEHDIQEWCSNLFESIRKTIQLQLGIKINMGVGNIFHVLKSIHQSFSQAKTALISKNEEQQIIWFNGIEQRQQDDVEEYCASRIDKVQPVYQRRY